MTNEERAKILDQPGKKLHVQKMLLSDLSLKMYKEQDKEKKADLMKELQVLSMATNSIVQCREQLNNLHKLYSNK